MRSTIKTGIISFLLAAIFSWNISITQANAQESKQESQLKVYIYPALVPDSGVCNIFSDRISRFDFLFYYEGDKPIKDLNQKTFTLDLPKGIAVRSVALMAGWRKSGGKFYEFKQEKIKRGDQEYTRYWLPLPPVANNKIVPRLGGIEGGICYNHAKIFVEPRVAAPESFDAYWSVKEEAKNKELKGSFKVKLFSSPYDIEKPKRLTMRAGSWGDTSLYADTIELSSIVQLFKLLGISEVPAILKGKLDEAGRPDLWSKAGFKFYDGKIWGVLNAYSLAQRTQSPDDKDYLKGLDGKISKGGDWHKHHGRLFCPICASTPGRFAFEKLKNSALKTIADGAKLIDLDLEIHYWNQCFCDDCLKEYSEFSNIPYEKLKEMKPADIIMIDPMKWYRFRNAQTAALYRNLKKEIQKKHPEVKIGANNVLNYPEYDLGELTWGVCCFGEDPRLIDDSVDYHLVDTLMGCVADPVWIDAQRRNVEKPLIAVVGCTYTTCFSHCNSVGRRYIAEQKNVGAGFDVRGSFLKLGMVHLVASGASGLRLAIDDDNGIIDAEVAEKAAEASEILAKTEDYYLDGIRADEDLEVIDMTSEESPYSKDKTLVTGNIWKHYYDLYGHVQYRVHRRKNDMLISLFNWDPYQDKEWLIRLKDAPGTGFSVCDIINGKAFLLRDKKMKIPAKWSKKQLEDGILLTIPAGDMKIIRLGNDFAENMIETELIPTKEREDYLLKASKLKPANQYAWRKGKKFDIRKNIIKEWKRRLLKHMPETIPQKYLDELKDKK